MITVWGVVGAGSSGQQHLGCSGKSGKEFQRRRYLEKASEQSWNMEGGVHSVGRTETGGRRKEERGRGGGGEPRRAQRRQEPGIKDGQRRVGGQYRFPAGVPDE